MRNTLAIAIFFSEERLATSVRSSPYPADGSNGPTVLGLTGVVRNDIRPSFASDQVYAQSGYAGSAANSAQVTLASDGVFSDGATLELATVTGSVAAGLTATLTVAI